MDGNSRFELMSASPDSNFVGNCQSGLRGYPTPSLGRSSSFREGPETKNISSAKLNSRVNTCLGDGPALSQCLMLDPIFMGDPKYARSGDLRRVLGFSVGSNLEENSSAVGHLKNSPPAAEELKRLRASVADTCVKASGRVKKLDEHLTKLNKYIEVMPSKKSQQQQRNELFTNERSNGPTLKIGQILRNSSEVGSQKFDDRPKNVGLSKRLRTSTTENLADCRINGVMRQTMMVTKERDNLKDNNVDSDVAEEKLRRLPAGGESWDKKMKRKRSVGAVVSRSVDSDGELKRNMHHKLNVESSLLSSDPTHGYRSGASGGGNKLDPMPSPCSTPRVTFKNEQEKSMPSRDQLAGQIKERPFGKVNVKLTNREDSNAIYPGPIVKGKASRAPRSGSTAAANAAANISRLSATLESWDPAQLVNKNPSIVGSNNRKRTMPSGSASPPITQWGGQRPQKMSRTRRTNLIPVSNNDDILMQSEGCSPSDLGPRISINGINASLPPKSAANGNQNYKLKSENVPSPARLSESEEFGAGENRMNDKGVGSRDLEERTANTGLSAWPTIVPTKKNKILSREDIGDGVRRQGRSGRVSPFSGASISPTREKLDNVVPTKPLRTPRSNSDKAGSKSGRPLKKLSDRKGFSRLGHVANGGSPDCSGESDDDRDDLLTAANLACNSSFNSCSSAFWKTFEALFTSVGPEENVFLSQQLKIAQDSCISMSQYQSNGNPEQVKLDDCCHEMEDFHGNKSMNDSVNRMGFVDQHNSSLHGCSDVEKRFDKITPLYQRLLSALILEDEFEESEETGFGRQRSSVNDSCFLSTENTLEDKLGFCEQVFGVQNRKNGNPLKIFPCNGNMDIDRSPGATDLICNGELIRRDGSYMCSEVEAFVRFSRCDNIAQSLQTKNNCVAAFDFEYEQMTVEEKLVLELQSVGMFLEAVPALDDKEDNSINQEIARLDSQLHEQTGKKKTCLDKIHKAIQEGNETKRDLEQVAMDKLVELAYKKLLATKGSFASKHGISKVSKQVALAFCKRTLARCRKYEDSGISCFSESALRDIVYASPPQFAESDLLSAFNPTATNDGTSIRQPCPASAKNGPMSNRGKKKELSLDDVSDAAFRASSGLIPIGGAKGRRSDRDPSIKNGKAGRLSMGGSKGERRTKSKPKQRTAQLSMSGVNKFMDTVDPTYPSAGNSSEPVNRRKDVRFLSSGNAPSADVKQSLDLSSLPINGIDELGVDTETGDPKDFSSLLDFDIEEHDGLGHDTIGLEIPMDDLSELF